MPLVGGNCNNGLNCGAYVNLNNTASNANWNIAPGHSYQTKRYQGESQQSAQERENNMGRCGVSLIAYGMDRAQ